MISDTEPTRFGPYRVEDSLGAGATGEVYRAVGPDGERVAVKVPRFPGELSQGEATRWVGRYLEAVSSGASVTHPHIVSVLEIHRRDDPPFVVTEYVAGGSLQDRLVDSGGLRVGEMVARVEELADALDAAHQEERLHLDLHPGNVLVDPRRGALLAGLGEGALIPWGDEEAALPSTSLAYASPELVAGRSATGASDQYSLASIVYRVLSGRRPFSGDDPAELRYRVVHHAPVPIPTLQPDLPHEVHLTMRRAMHRDPLQRFPDCSTFAEALGESLDDVPPERLLPLAEPSPGEGAKASGGRRVTSSEGEAATGDSSTGRSPVGRVGTQPLKAGRKRVPRSLVAGALLIVVAGVGAAWWLVGSLAPSEDLAPTASTERPVGAGATEEAEQNGSEAGRVQRGQERGAERSEEAPAGGVQSEESRAEAYRITSRPSKAHVMLDGVPTRMTTPVELAIEKGVEHRLTLAREGYETLNWKFSVEELRPEQRDSRHLHFLLTPTGSDGRATADGVPLLRAPGQIPAPERVRRVDPVYPPELRRQGVEGYAILEVTIDTDGRVVEAEVLKGLHPVLDQAAVDAVLEWRYRPSRRDNEPVRIRYAVTVRFPPS